MAGEGGDAVARKKKAKEERTPVPAAEGAFAGMSIAERRAAQRELEKAEAEVARMEGDA